MVDHQDVLELRLIQRDDRCMVTGYGGTYRAEVVDDADPLQQYRLGVVVPDVYGDGVPVWALALSAESPMPIIGDLVWVSFEHGDTDYPIWQLAAGADDNTATGDYIGKYHGVVVRNDDPMQRNRLEVTVPEVNPSSAWAEPSEDLMYSDPPDIGSDVWVEYENGDPAYPRWVGVG
jgi:type VI secretion system (T6SS) baseplate-like injector VgrG